MPTVYGYKIRWVTDEVPCTSCGTPYDDKWFALVKVAGTGDFLCPACLPVWKEQAKAEEDMDLAFVRAARKSRRRRIIS
jgi:hypothetical protein